MQSDSQRSLPSGWVEHFDSQRKIWYYVDLDSEPPRVSLVHPSEGQTAPSSAPGRFGEQGTRTPRPAGPRESASPSTSLRPGQRRPRRATVAQQLYASSLPANQSNEALLGGHITPEPKRTTSGQGTDTDAPNSDMTASDSASSSTPPLMPPRPPNIRVSPSANVNAATGSSPVSPTHQLDVRNPRHLLDCARLAGTRRVTYSGPQPRIKRTAGAFAPDATSTAPPPTADAQSLYHHSTRMATPSPSSLPKPSVQAPATTTAAEDRLQSTISPAPTARRQNKQPASNASNEIIGTNSAASEPSLPPSRLKPAVASSKISPNHEDRGYTAIVSDDLSLNPASSAETTSRPTLRRLEINNVANRSSNDSASCPRPLPSISTRTVGENNSSHTMTQASVPPIIQPKPMRPMAGVTLNLQVQVSTVSSGQENGEGSPASRRKLPLLTSIKGGFSSKAKGKMPIRTIQDAERMEISPVGESLLL